MRIVHLLAALSAASALCCSACYRTAGSFDQAAAYVRPDDVVNFWTLYNENCSACHGQNGQNGPALDLANPVYQSLVDDGSLKKWITRGIPGTEMPAFGVSAGGFLTEDQIDALVAGIRANWAKENLGSANLPAYSTTSQGDVKSGEQTYNAVCLSCHQRSEDRVSDPSYLALVSDQALRTITIAGRPDLGQPDWQQVRPDRPLTNDEVSNVVAYLASLRISTPGQPYPNRE
jgi:cytochrome c oxidase cbb3-type subunit III